MQHKCFKFISIITFVIVLIFSFSVHAETLPIIGECEDLNSTDLSIQMAYEIDSRISGITASDATKMLWSSRGDGTEGWTRSSTVWIENGTTPLDFTGASPWNNVVPVPPATLGIYTGAGTLISPRHIVFANHYQIPNGSTVVFVDNSNNIISRTIVSQMQVASSDIQVALLDSDVPSSITYYPIVDLATLQNYWKTVLSTPIIVLDQEDKALIKEINYGFSGNFMHYYIPSVSPRDNFDETLIGGDSGNPIFLVIGGRLVLLSSVYSAYMGPFFSSQVNDINSAMTSLGGDYQVSTIDLSCFTPQSVPTFNVSSTTFSVNENSPVDTEIGAVLATGSEPFTYSFTSGNDNNVFAVNATTGDITVNNQSLLNYESTPSFTLTLKAQNTASWYWPIAPNTTTVIINLVDVVEPPVFGDTSYTANINEDAASSSSIVKVSAIDPNAEQTISYEILSGNTDNAFTISPTTGQITVTDTNLLDYDIHNSYNLIVEASSDATPSLSATVPVTINIGKTNRPTVFFESSSSTHNEDSGTVQIALILSHTYTKDISLTLNTVNGSALLNTNFALSTDTVSILKGQAAGTFPINVVYNAANESDKVFDINIVSASKANIAAPSTYVFTIKNVYHPALLSGGGGNVYIPPVTTPTIIPGCDDRTTGFSVSTGQSCVGSSPIPTTPTVIPGCDDRTTGFSTSTGQSCVGSSPTTTPSLTTAYNFGTATLKNGSRGETVKELQRFLNTQLNIGLIIDGILGPKTVSIIKIWQKANDLVADGIVGPKTKAKMGLK